MKSRYADGRGGNIKKVASDCFYFSEFSLRKAIWGKGVGDLNREKDM